MLSCLFFMFHAFYYSTSSIVVRQRGIRRQVCVAQQLSLRYPAARYLAASYPATNSYPELNSEKESFSCCV